MSHLLVDFSNTAPQFEEYFMKLRWNQARAAALLNTERVAASLGRESSGPVAKLVEFWTEFFDCNDGRRLLAWARTLNGKDRVKALFNKEAPLLAVLAFGLAFKKACAVWPILETLQSCDISVTPARLSIVPGQLDFDEIWEELDKIKR